MHNDFVKLLLTTAWTKPTFSVAVANAKSLKRLIASTVAILWLITRHHSTLNARKKLPVWVTKYFANRSADPRVSQKKQNPPLKVDSLKTAYDQLSDILLEKGWTRTRVFKSAR